MTRDGKIHWQANPASSLLALGTEQTLKGLKLIRREMGEGHAMENPSLPFSLFSGSSLPDHLSLDFDSTAVRLELDAEEARDEEVLVQFQACTAFAQQLLNTFL